MRVLTIGTFDLFHAGHAFLLGWAAMFGELHVGVNTDTFVKKYKGRAPALPIDERGSVIRELPFVKGVYANEDAGDTLIRELMPDLIAIGSDWHVRNYLGQINVTQEWLDEKEIGVLYIPRKGLSSTTRVREQLRV